MNRKLTKFKVFLNKNKKNDKSFFNSFTDSGIFLSTEKYIMFL